ncbi:MAG TPA: WD40 repeat domain-containing protein [Bacillota bacterium]|jgi:WD40 repeat protein
MAVTRPVLILLMVASLLVPGCRHTTSTKDLFAFVNEARKVAIYTPRSHHALWISPEEASSCIWSQDGKHLIHTSVDDPKTNPKLRIHSIGSQEAYAVALDFDGDPTLVARMEWSPTGQHLLVSGSGYPSRVINVVDIQRRKLILKAGVWGEKWSPDGQKLAYSEVHYGGTVDLPEGGAGYCELKELTLADGNSTLLLRGDDGHSVFPWSWNGQEVVYIDTSVKGKVIKDTGGTIYTSRPSPQKPADKPAPTQMPKGIGEVRIWDFSPKTGSWLFQTVEQDGSSVIWLSVPGREIMRIGKGRYPVWQPQTP